MKSKAIILNSFHEITIRQPNFYKQFSLFLFFFSPLSHLIVSTRNEPWFTKVRVIILLSRFTLRAVISNWWT